MIGLILKKNLSPCKMNTINGNLFVSFTLFCLDLQLHKTFTDLTFLYCKYQFLQAVHWNLPHYDHCFLISIYLYILHTYYHAFNDILKQPVLSYFIVGIQIHW